MKNTDAFILMQFIDAVRHLKGLPVESIKGDMLRLGQPFIDRLMGNGHTRMESAQLIRAAWNTI